MIMDPIDALELLREAGIRVARARYVESAEDAVFFADGRPIVLRVVLSGSASALNGNGGSLTTTDAIRHAFKTHEPQADTFATGHVLAQRSIPAGTDIVIECRDDVTLGRIAELRCGTHHVQRLVPIESVQAESMLAEFHAKHGIAHDAKSTRMLAHLIERLSALFADPGISRLSLNPVRLHDSTYDVIDATVEARRAVPLKPRLAPHAHDRKASYRP